MKKCPKCGTVLDDSKKKCYMCGADLLKSSAANFGDSFNSQIGATMSGGQANVFSTGNRIESSVNGSSGQTTSSSPIANGNSLFQNQMNGLNSLQYDERSKLEKIFDSGSKKKKEEKKKNKKEEVIKNTGTFNSNAGQKQGVPTPSSGFTNINDFKIPTQIQNVAPQTTIPHTTLKREEKKEKPDINWGDNLSNSSNNFWKFRDKVDKKNGPAVNVNLIFNFLCFILCIFGVCFVYFKFIKKEPVEEAALFGGLKYVVDENFTLKSDDNHSRYYTYGDNCALRINYGVTNDPSGFVETYFNQVKDTYANQDGYSTSMQKLTINGNQWSELSVQGIKENAAAPNGYTFFSKYKHVAIVYKENYYDIVYANTEDDTTCSGMYDKLIGSFEFES